MGEKRELLLFLNTDNYTGAIRPRQEGSYQCYRW